MSAKKEDINNTIIDKFLDNNHSENSNNNNINNNLPLKEKNNEEESNNKTKPKEKKKKKSNKVEPELKDIYELIGQKRVSERIRKTGVKNLNEKAISQDLYNKQTKNEIKICSDDDDKELTLSDSTISEDKDYEEELKRKEIEKKEKLLNIPPKFHSKMKPLKFTITGSFNRARASVLKLPHGEVDLPIFMPVGTKAAMKGLLSCDLERMGCKLMLSNTYHLHLQPGDDFIYNNYKNVHNLMKWKKNVLTDSGGFQMVSLDKNMTVTEEGVTFTSHIKDDDRKIFLTPEKSINIQNNLGSDIIMMLDDVLRPNSSEERLKEACHRTIRWLDRCIKAHKNPKTQNLFPIVQGGLDLDLRKWCCDEMVKRDQPGYAIGGLAGGEEKNDFWKVVNVCCENLPKDKPRYLMGLGYPLDLVVCVLLGCDMFDCVFPTRTARFGTAFTNKGFIKLKNNEMKFDFNPIDKECDCEVCKTYSRSYFYLMMNSNPRAASLVSYHNVYYLLKLMGRIRAAIKENKVQEFIDIFFVDYFSYESRDDIKNKYGWVFDALNTTGYETTEIRNRLDL